MSEKKVEAEAVKKTAKKSSKENGSSTVDSIIESVEKLTVLELVDLVKALEDRFGVTAAAPVAVTGAPSAGGEAQAEEEKTDFTVVLTSFGDKKIQVIKVIREITGLGLKEAKDLVDKVPSNVKESVVKEDAEAIKKKIEDAGGIVELK